MSVLSCVSQPGGIIPIAGAIDNGGIMWDGTSGCLVQNVLNLLYDDNGQMSLGSGVAPGAQLDITARDATTVGHIIEAASGQTANLLELNSNGGSGGDIFKIASSGIITATNNLSLTGNALIETPLIIGGAATTSDISFQTTSGVGATGADMHFLVGSNGATEAMTILNSGYIGIGTLNPSAYVTILNDSIADYVFYVQGATDYFSSGQRICARINYSAKFNIGGTGSYRGLQVQISPGVTRDLAGELTGMYYQVYIDRALTLAYAYGSNGLVSAAAGTITNAIAFHASGQVNGGDITNYYSFYAKPPVLTSGTMSNVFGVYIGDYTGGSVTSYSIYSVAGLNYFGGNVGIGNVSANYPLEVLNTSTQFCISHTNSVDYSTFGVDENGMLTITTVDGGGASGHINLIPDGNLGLNTTSFGANALNSFAIANGTAPTTSIANQIEIFSTDISGGDATLGLRTESSVAADTDETQFSHKLAVKINGTNYYFMLIAA